MALDIVLHQWEISPFCGKVARILEHKELQYRTVNYNGLLARKARKLSPTGKLPVLEYNGQFVHDSTEIALFLDIRHPDPPLYPLDRVVRAEAELWEDWADESLSWFLAYFRFMDREAARQAVDLLSAGRPRFERMLLALTVPRSYRKRLRAQGLGRQPREQVEDSFMIHLNRLETVLEARPWLANTEDRTIADIAVAAQITEIMRTSKMRSEIMKRKHVVEWMEHV